METAAVAPDILDLPYQTEGAAFLSQRTRALLADEMGLGKSRQAILAVEPFGNKAPILVICPAVARRNWANEFAKFSARKGVVIESAADFTKVMPFPSFVILSYDMAATPKASATLKKIQWEALILDECHYLKNRQAKRTKAIYTHLFPAAHRVFALSGTPAPNDPSELWTLMRAFEATNLPYWDFVKRYCITRDTPFRTQIIGGKNIDELRKLMEPFTLRRKKEDVMKQLPPLFFTDVTVEPGKISELRFEEYFKHFLYGNNFKDEMQRQEKLISDLIWDLKAGDNAVKGMAAIEAKVKPLRRWVGIQKAVTVAELVTAELEAKAYDKIVLFAVHLDVIRELRERLAPFKPVVITGEVGPKARDQAIHDFQEKATCRVFIGQITAAGIAINLTAAHQVGVVEADWTPATNMQAVMRCHRIGQKKTVSVRFFSLANSIDQKIQTVLRQKTKTLADIFDQGRSNCKEDFNPLQ